MKRYGLAFFDLDGTVTESGEGIMNSVEYALGKMGAPVPERTALRAFVGPPLSDSFARICGMDADGIATALKYYREYYTAKGMDENRLYPGIRELFDALRGAGIRVVLATAKPEVYLDRILGGFGIKDCFDFIFGAELDGPRSDKTEVIRFALSSGHIDPADAVMVGDRKYDVEGAAASGMDSVGVLYGYGTRAELEAAGATYIAGTVRELGDMLLGR